MRLETNARLRQDWLSLALVNALLKPLRFLAVYDALAARAAQDI